MTDKPTLTTPLLSFDFRATLAGKANELAKNAPPTHETTEPAPTEPTIPTPQPPSGPRRRMATKKTAAPAPANDQKPVPAERPRWHSVVRNWKTEDEQLDFELRFDAEGDPQVTVFDADHDEPVTLSVSVDSLSEVIEILREVLTNSMRIRSGQLTAEDPIEEERPARRVDEDEGDRE